MSSHSKNLRQPKQAELCLGICVHTENITQNTDVQSLSGQILTLGPLASNISLLISLKQRNILQKKVLWKWREGRYMCRAHEFWCSKVFIKFRQAVLSSQPKQSRFTLDLRMLLCVNTYGGAMDLS